MRSQHQKRQSPLRTPTEMTAQPLVFFDSRCAGTRNGVRNDLFSLKSGANHRRTLNRPSILSRKVILVKGRDKSDPARNGASTYGRSFSRPRRPANEVAGSP